MTKKGINRIFAAALSCAAVTALALPAAINAKNVGAGSSENYIMSSASVSGSYINEGDFFIKGNVYAKNDKIVFDDSCGKTASIISKASANNYKEYGIKDLFSLSLDMNVEKIVSGGKVSLVFGLKRSKDSVGAVNSAEIEFTYDDGIYVAVNEYKTAGEPSAVSAKRKYSLLSLNTAIKVNLRVDVNGKTYLTLRCNDNDVKILDGKAFTIDVSGAMGIVSVSSGEERNKFTLADMEALSYTYDAPETVDTYKETFEDRGYNANMFYSQSAVSPASPSGIYVENGELVFKNAGTCYFTTKEAFSNFELKFDVPFLAREGIVADDGAILQYISNWFMIGFGVKNYDDPPSEGIQATFLQFDYLQHDGALKKIDHVNPTSGMINNRYVLWRNGKAVKITSMGEQNIWNKNYVGDKTVNVKFTVIDGALDMYYKLDDEADYGEARFHYDLGAMQTGYVRIYSYGDSAIPANGIECVSALNMRIDNFEITNLDKKDVRPTGKIIPFRSNIFKTAEDFDYTTKPDPSDLLRNKLGK